MDIFGRERIERLNKEVERLNGEIENLRKELADNKVDNRVLNIRIKDLEKMLQDKQDEMNEYIDELDHMVIERSNLVEKNNRQSDIINTLKNEVKRTKEKFNELVKLSEEYREEMERKLEEKKIVDTKVNEKIIEDLEKECERIVEESRRNAEEIRVKREREIIEGCESLRGVMLKKIRDERDAIGQEVLTLREELKSLETIKDELILQEINMIDNPYEYESSQEFQAELNKIKREQKEMVRNGLALVFSTTWTVANSKVKGEKMMKNLSKLALKSFNNECDNIIINVKYSSMATAQAKIEKSFKDTNKFVEVMECKITNEYLDLKIRELQLKCGWLEKREEEKEELRYQAEMLKEQERIEKEIQEAKEKIQYEQTQYSTEIKRLEEQLKKEQGNNDTIMKQLAKLQDKLAKLEGKKKDVLNREINKKAGWVYVISNDSFEGKEVYKVGVTRALDYRDRIAQLSSASVPFKFKVNSVIFSEDAFALETALHRAFTDKRWNKANLHKEFFLVSLDEIKKEVLKYNPTATFIDNPIDEEYMKTMQM